jgi:hypothetical protein
MRIQIIPKHKPDRHNCGLPEWRICCVCDGRIHWEGCTSKRRASHDCCPARHKMLHDNGTTRGISDSSMAMWSKAFPEGYHDPK